MLIDRFDWESAWIAVAADLGLGSQVVRRRRGPSQLQCVGFAQSSFFFFSAGEGQVAKHSACDCTMSTLKTLNVPDPEVKRSLKGCVLMRRSIGSSFLKSKIGRH